MVKGNIGNLMQHFVVLRVAQRMLELWQKPEIPIEYIDCFSMAPWEPIEVNKQGFANQIESFASRRRTISSRRHLLMRGIRTTPQGQCPPELRIACIRIPPSFFATLFRHSHGPCDCMKMMLQAKVSTPCCRSGLLCNRMVDIKWRGIGKNPD